MKTLAIIAQKGGSGKTTVAVHLAVCAAHHGKATGIIDLDPQGSAAKWSEVRNQKTPQVTTATQSQLGRLLENAQKAKTDFVIIDTAPHSDSDAAMAAQLADFVLIPSRPMFFDLHAILSTYDIAQLSKTPAAIVLNGVPPRGSLTDEAREALQGQNIRVVEPVLYHRSAYFNALFDGRSVQEYEPKGKAAAEIEHLYISVSRALKMKP
jgi:chromosome partitioning protein